jgi:hypothetical protein
MAGWNRVAASRFGERPEELRLVLLGNVERLVGLAGEDRDGGTLFERLALDHNLA